MEESSIKIKKKISLAIESYLNEVRKIKNYTIRSVEDVSISDLRGLPSSQTELYSGKEFKINVYGNVAFMAKEIDGYSSKNPDFFVVGMIIKFNSEEENFEIVDFGKLV